MLRATVINPHDEDGMIGAGGTIIQLLEKDWEIMYVQMTDGRHGGKDIPWQELKKIRAKESEAERDFLGIEKFYNFDIEDGSLARLNNDERKQIVNKLKEIIDDFKPNVIFLTSKAEAHTDHREAHYITKEALETTQTKPLEVNYLVWLLPFLKQDSESLEKIIKIPIDNWWEKKRKAILFHDSQEKRRNYTKIIENLNSYLSLIYSKYQEDGCDKVEILGIKEINENYELFLNDLEGVKDVTQIYHGRENKKIEL